MTFNGPLPTMMQRGRLFRFNFEWRTLTGQQFCQAFSQTDKIVVCGRVLIKWLHSSAIKSLNQFYFSWKWMSPLTFQVHLKKGIRCTAQEWRCLGNVTKLKCPVYSGL